MDNLEKVKRHLGRPIPLSLTNEDGDSDVFYFKSLNIEQQSILMELSRKIKSKEMIELEGKKVPDINKEDMKDMFDLVLDICRVSMEGLDEPTLLDFANNNFEQISNKIDTLIPNQSKTNASLIKKRMELANVKPSTGNKE